VARDQMPYCYLWHRLNIGVHCEYGRAIRLTNQSSFRSPNNAEVKHLMERAYFGKDYSHSQRHVIFVLLANFTLPPLELRQLCSYQDSALSEEFEDYAIHICLLNTSI